MGYFTGSFFIPFVTNVYQIERKYSPSWVGLMMGVMAFSYVTSIPVYTKVLPKINYRVSIYIGYILLLSGCYISTMDPWSDVTGQMTFGFIGIILGGIGNCFSLLPIMPEMVTGIEEHYAKEGVKFDKEELHNNLAGYF